MMKRKKCSHKMSASSLLTTGLLISFAIFSRNIDSINAGETEPKEKLETLVAKLSEQHQQFLSTLQGHTALLDKMGKHLANIEQAQLRQQQREGAFVAGSSSSSSSNNPIIFTSNFSTSLASTITGDSSHKPQQNTKLPPLPKCNNNSAATPITSSSGTSADEAETAATRRQFIAEMTLSAWNAYKQHAWGSATLRPLSLEPKGGEYGDLGPGSGETLIGSLSTLLLMNLTEPVREGLAWAVNDTAFNLSTLNRPSLLFERHVAGQLGGLLSAYALLTANITGAAAAAAQEVKMAPRWLLQKATEYGALLKPAYNDTAILPYSDFNLRSASKRGGPSLSQAGGQYLEHAYLSALTGDQSYRQTVERIRDRLKVDAWSPLDGLYDVNPNTGREFRDYYRPRMLLDRWHRDEFYQRQFRLRYRKMSLGTEGRDFYYALLRSYLQSGGKQVEALQLYNEAVSSVLQNSEMITTSTSTENGTGDGLVWVRDAIFVNGTTVSEYGERMSYSACYLGAMFALGAATFKEEDDRCHPLARRQRQLAVELTRTCHKAATGLPIRLPPDEWKMPNVLNEAIDYKSGENKHYYLTPELAESYFILWRTTKDPQYREAAWEMARALKRYSQTESGGFAGFIDLTSFTKKDNQPSIFLSATLKYLYLTFTDDSVLPLDKWIFNSAGHPLPICGQHEHLPLEKCKYSTQV